MSSDSDEGIVPEEALYMDSDEERDALEKENYEEEGDEEDELYEDNPDEEEEEGEEEEEQGEEEETERMPSQSSKQTSYARTSKFSNATPSQNTTPGFSAQSASKLNTSGASTPLTLTDITRIITARQSVKQSPSQAIKNPMAQPSSNNKTEISVAKAQIGGATVNPLPSPVSSFSQNHKGFIIEEAMWRREISKMNTSWLGSLPHRKLLTELIICGVVNGYIRFPCSTFYWVGSHSSFDSEPNRRLCGLGKTAEIAVCPIIDDNEIKETVCKLYKDAMTYTIDKIELVSYTNKCDKPIVLRCKSHHLLNGHFAASDGAKAMALLQPNTTITFDQPKSIYCIRKLLANPLLQRQLLFEYYNPSDVSATQIDEGEKKKKTTFVLIPSEMLEERGQKQFKSSKDLVKSFMKYSKGQGGDYYDNRYLLSFLLNQGSRHKLYGEKTPEIYWSERELPFKKQGSIQRKGKKWWIGLEPEFVQSGLTHFQRYMKESQDLSPIRLSELELSISPETTTSFSDDAGSEYGYTGNISDSLTEIFLAEKAKENTANRLILVELKISVIPSVLDNSTLAAPAASKQEPISVSMSNKGVNIGNGGTIL